MADNTYTNISDLPTLETIGEGTWVPVETTNKEGKKVDLNSVTPGTLNTNNSTSQMVKTNESLSGTVNLHKVAKTGAYNDLLNKPTIPTVGTLNTNNSSAQSISMSESLSGTIKLHKVAKTGSYNDLLNKPKIEDLQSEKYSGSNYVMNINNHNISLKEYVIAPIHNMSSLISYEFNGGTADFIGDTRYGAAGIRIFYEGSEQYTTLDFNEYWYSGWDPVERIYHYELDDVDLVYLIFPDNENGWNFKTKFNQSYIKIKPYNGEEFTLEPIPVKIAYNKNYVKDGDGNYPAYDDSFEDDSVYLTCINGNNIVNNPTIDPTKEGFIRITYKYFEIIQP